MTTAPSAAPAPVARRGTGRHLDRPSGGSLEPLNDPFQTLVRPSAPRLRVLNWRLEASIHDLQPMQASVLTSNPGERERPLDNAMLVVVAAGRRSIGSRPIADLKQTALR